MADKARTVLSVCNNMGEGWLLTAEMLDLIDHGAPNIICTQPFACLPNHVVGKAVIASCAASIPRATSSRWTTTPARPRSTSSTALSS